MKRPYIGITGITTTEQVQVIAETWNKLEFPGYDLMMGFLLSSSQTPNCVSYPPASVNPRNVDIEKLPELLGCASKSVKLKPLGNDDYAWVVRAIHYHTKNRVFFPELSWLIENYWKDGQTGFDAIQLNIARPAPEEINKFQQKWDIDLILQVNRSIIEHYFPDSEHEIGARFDTSYMNCPYYLIDGSGGRGLPIDIQHSYYIKKAMMDCGFTNRFGVAGGISAENVADIISDFPRWSIDAESQLRNEQNKLDLEKVDQYLHNASRAITERDDSVEDEEIE